MAEARNGARPGANEVTDGWPPGPARPNLATGEVHVWRANLDASARIDELALVLSDDERKRADRFAFPHLRERFVAGRASLRLILSRYVNTLPDAVSFVYGPHGKPALARSERLDGHKSFLDTLRFNVSHSGDLALYAVCLGGEIGIDVEHVRPLPDMERLVARYFSPAEQRAFRHLPSEARPAGFFACWTRKEAFLKAHGGGLTLPLDAFDMSVNPAQPARLLASRLPGDDAARWYLRDLHLVGSFAAALAVKGADWRVSRWSYSLPWR